jgi:Na+/H+ antiporter NhaD/arsenite permease-like protein
MLLYQYFLLVFFIVGYGLLIFEHQLKVNKSAIALITGTFMWVLYFQIDPASYADKYTHLFHHLSDISQVLLFLIGAMTIVELIASHQGFEAMKPLIMIESPRKLFWALSLIGFWMSSVLDNLTTILVLVSLLRQTVNDAKLRRILAAGLVFVVNVGGAWTPIGDITTTMLWISGMVNTVPLMASIGLPSILSLLVFASLYSITLPKTKVHFFPKKTTTAPRGSLPVLLMGVLGFIAVPILKITLDLPPFMGMMISLGVIWIVTDGIHRDREDSKHLKVEYILTKIDISCVLFFLGVLLAVAGLESAGILNWMAVKSQQTFSNPYSFTMVMGILSALVDNVPLVAGIINMYDSSVYPPDHLFWALNAYCAGVGGSLLIIGSAPGVALMSLKDVRFFWYLKRVSWAAFLAYFSGWASIYLLEQITKNIPSF